MTHGRGCPDSPTENALRLLVDALKGPDPLPAGGAAGIAAVAMGIAVGMKVIRFSPDGPPDLTENGLLLELLSDCVLPEFTRDCVAFGALLESLRLPRDEKGRPGAIREKWLAATEAPVSVAKLARRAETVLSSCEGHVNPNLAGDLTAALELVRAGRRIAESNARENAQRLEPEVRERLLDKLASDGRA